MIQNHLQPQREVEALQTPFGRCQYHLLDVVIGLHVAVGPHARKGETWASRPSQGTKMMRPFVVQIEQETDSDLSQVLAEGP